MTKEFFNIVSNNIDCVMTKKSHVTGSDRVYEVSEKCNTPWILNLEMSQ